MKRSYKEAFHDKIEGILYKLRKIETPTNELKKEKKNISKNENLSNSKKKYFRDRIMSGMSVNDFKFKNEAVSLANQMCI